MLVLLAAAYFFFMAIDAALVDISSCISEIIEVHSDVLVDLLVVTVLVGEATWVAIGSWRG